MGKLIVDSMLGNIAKKLRLMGQDAVYFKGGNDEDLLKRYKDRTLVTSDKELYLKSKKAYRKAIYIDSEMEEQAALARIFLMINETPSEEPLRCTVCNGILRTAKEEEKVNLPYKIAESDLKIYVCTRCHKLYWFGKHWDSIRLLRKSVEEQLNALKAEVSTE